MMMDFIHLFYTHIALQQNSFDIFHYTIINNRKDEIANHEMLEFC